MPTAPAMEGVPSCCQCACYWAHTLAHKQQLHALLSEVQVSKCMAANGRCPTDTHPPTNIVVPGTTTHWHPSPCQHKMPCCHQQIACWAGRGTLTEVWLWSGLLGGFYQGTETLSKENEISTSLCDISDTSGLCCTGMLCV